MNTVKSGKQKIVAGIFARGGSKGVPNKNIREVGGKTLLQRAIEQAHLIPHISEVYCSTDSPEIAKIATDHGALVPWLRPAELAQDDSKEWDSWSHLITWLNNQNVYPSHLVSVPTVAPMRKIEDISNCVDLALSSNADVVIAVSEAKRNPWFNIVSFDKNSDQVRLVNQPKTRIHNRQEAPIVYDVSTVTFVINCDYLLRAKSIYDGDTRAIVLPSHRCLDIDTEEDFEIAEFLLKKSGT